MLYYSVKAFEDSHVDDIILVCEKDRLSIARIRL